ncbi:copper amine oxidase [Paenibacillus protaetiae]|uniref:Copper amine oxidase n=1 Tax=Paenibacillus protaetiae TaxID=2509456 RepID=A0A4P6EW53_9BACL|nr:copper amine oxidase [Paenibacillus protaetiae]
MKLNRSSLWLCAAIVLLLLLHKGAAKEAASLTVADETPREGNWTVYYQDKGGYQLAKWEPEQGAYLGAYVVQDQTIHANMDTFNRLTGKKHASFFKYVGYGSPYPAEWVQEVIAAGGFPQIAWEPNDGLDQVKDDNYLRQFAEAAGKSGVPVFIRFASEMNGTWTLYSSDPDSYIDKWRLVYRVLHDKAPNAAMVWTVLNVPEKPIESFYPGDAYVDWVGINMYSVKYHDGDIKRPAGQEDPLAMLDYVYNLYSRTKPIQISEFGATHYNATDGLSDTGFAAGKISRLYSHLEQLYPRVKAVYYFDVNNLTEYNVRRKINNYSITAEPDLLRAYELATASPYFLSGYYAGGTAATTVNQTFTNRGNIEELDGVIYADISLFTQLLQLKLDVLQDGNVRLTRRSQPGEAARTAAGKLTSWQASSGYTDWLNRPVKRDNEGLPLVQTAETLGYKVKISGNDIVITA